MVWNFAMPPENTNFWNTRKQIMVWSPTVLFDYMSKDQSFLNSQSEHENFHKQPVRTQIKYRQVNKARSPSSDCLRKQNVLSESIAKRFSPRLLLKIVKI